MRVNVILIVVGAVGTVPNWLGKRTEGIRDLSKNLEHPVKMSYFEEDTLKSPGNLKRLAVTQTPVKDHQLKVVWKTRKKKKIDNALFKIWIDKSSYWCY